MNHAIEQPPAKKRLSGTALRVVTVVPLVPIIVWMMFAGPRWAWHAFVLTAVAIAGYELMAMKVPSSRGLRTWGSASSVLFTYTIISVSSATALYAVVLLIVVAAMAWSLLQEDPLHNASVRIGWLIGTPVYVGGSLAAVSLVREFPPTGAWVFLAMAHKRLGQNEKGRADHAQPNRLLSRGDRRRARDRRSGRALDRVLRPADPGMSRSRRTASRGQAGAVLL